MQNNANYFLVTFAYCYWKYIKLHKQSSLYTTFNSPYGRCRFLRKPYLAQNSPKTTSKPLKLLISSLIQGSAVSAALARSNGLITRQNGTLQEHLSDFEEFNRIWKKKNVKKGLSDCVKEHNTFQVYQSKMTVHHWNINRMVHLSQVPVKHYRTQFKYQLNTIRFKN